jgi:hypothetical protein
MEEDLGAAAVEGEQREKEEAPLSEAAARDRCYATWDRNSRRGASPALCLEEPATWKQP